MNNDRRRQTWPSIDFVFALALPVIAGIVVSWLIFGSAEQKYRSEYHGIGLLLFDFKEWVIGGPNPGYTRMMVGIGSWFAISSLLSNLIYPSGWIFLIGPALYCWSAYLRFSSDPTPSGHQGLALIVIAPLILVSIPGAILGAVVGALSRWACLRHKSALWNVWLKGKDAAISVKNYLNNDSRSS